MVTALTCTSGFVTVWHVLMAWLQYWQLRYTKRAPLVNSSDAGPVTRLSVDTSDHRDVRTVTWNHGHDGLWSESHVSFVAVAVRCLPIQLSLQVFASSRFSQVFTNSPFSQVFTSSPFSQAAPSPVEHTASAISIESTALISSSPSLRQHRHQLVPVHQNRDTFNTDSTTLISSSPLLSQQHRHQLVPVHQHRDTFNTKTSHVHRRHHHHFHHTHNDTITSSAPTPTPTPTHTHRHTHRDTTNTVVQRC